MKCVVTGATGHIGNVLVRYLVEQGYEVKAFVLKNEPLTPLRDFDISYAYGDVRDYASLKEAFEGADMVFHLAGIIEIGSGNKRLTYEVNVNGTKNVVKACKECQVKRLVYTSSVHAIQESKGKGKEIHETNEYDPRLVKGVYAKTKAEATAFVLASPTDTFEVVVVQPSGVIGPYEYVTSNLGQLIQDCSNKGIGACVSGGYNFVDVRDVADGIIRAAQKGRSGETYILAGHIVTVRQLMDQIEKITSVKAPKFMIARWFAYGTGFLSEVYYKLLRQKPLFTSYAIYTLGTNDNFSIEKAKTELGYQVRDFEETLKDTIDWFREQGKIRK